MKLHSNSSVSPPTTAFRAEHSKSPLYCCYCILSHSPCGQMTVNVTSLMSYTLFVALSQLVYERWVRAQTKRVRVRQAAHSNLRLASMHVPMKYLLSVGIFALALVATASAQTWDQSQANVALRLSWAAYCPPQQISSWSCYWCQYSGTPSLNIVGTTIDGTTAYVPTGAVACWRLYLSSASRVYHFLLLLLMVHSCFNALI